MGLDEEHGSYKHNVCKEKKQTVDPHSERTSEDHRLLACGEGQPQCSARCRGMAPSQSGVRSSSREDDIEDARTDPKKEKKERSKEKQNHHRMETTKQGDV